MKTMKSRLLSVLLVSVLLIGTCLAPVASAVLDIKDKECPLIVIKGFAAVPLVKNAGTADEAVVFPTESNDSEAVLKEVIAAIVKGSYKKIADNSWAEFAKEIIPVFTDMFGDLAYNLDGTPVYPEITNKTYDTSLAGYTSDEKEEVASIIGVLYGKELKDELVYSFGYDWRESPIDSAAELNTFIEKVKAETGIDQVNIYAHSMGAAVALAYLSEYGAADNYSSVNNVVFASPAWQGTSLIGNAFTGNISVNGITLESYLVQLSKGSSVAYLASLFISTLATLNGLTEDYVPALNRMINGMLPTLYSDLVMPIFAGMPGIWSMIPADYYDDAKVFMFPDGMDAGFENKLDAYNAIQKNAKSIISDAMSNGVRFADICAYNKQIVPIAGRYCETSDGVIDTVYSSGGAICSPYLTTFEKDYTQAIYDGHNHVSEGLEIDASTCMFPEQTWFYRTLDHSGYKESDGTTDLTMWLLLMYKQFNVYTDAENYPQFLKYNTFDNKVEPQSYKDNGMRGDVNNDGKVTTDDARITLQVAARLTTLNGYQYSKAEVTGDGSITTDDARLILQAAASLVDLDADPEEAPAA